MEDKEKKMNTRKKTPAPKIKRAINGWKVAFLVLVGVLIGISLFLYFRISAVREPQLEEQTKVTAKQTSGEPVLQVQMTKKQMNEVIDYSLTEFLSDSKMTYRFYLENQALLNGTFKVLGTDVQFYLYFDPFVLENGNIELQAKSLSIGTLSLPIFEVMNFIKKSYDIPEWIEIHPKKKTIIVNLNKFQLQNGMYVRAQKMNLIDDDIRFDLYLPKDYQKKTETEDE